MDPTVAVSALGANGDFNMPVLLIVILLPIIFQGAGSISIDYGLSRFFNADATPEPLADAYAWSLALLALGARLCRS